MSGTKLPANPTITIHGHGLDLGDALRTHATERLDTMGRTYFDGNVRLETTFSQAGRVKGCSCTIRAGAGSGLIFDGSGSGDDCYKAFSVALECIDKQLRRRKRRLREDKPRNPIKALLQRQPGADIGAATAVG